MGSAGVGCCERASWRLAEKPEKQGDSHGYLLDQRKRLRFNSFDS